MKITMTTIVALVALAASSAFAAMPAEISAKMTEQLFRTEPYRYKPIGCDTERPCYGWGGVMYAVVAIWVNALECARTSGNKELENRLLEYYDNTCASIPKMQNKPDGVDDSIFGALPFEVAILRGKDPKAKTLGLKYADAQWEQPISEVRRINGVTPSDAELKELVRKGYSTQTRFWIDDMFMITFLQVQAYRATRDKKYLDRAAHQMRLYIETLQRDDGLFNHTLNSKVAWGRGNGWMAGGMTVLLKELPKDHPEYACIFESFEFFLEGIERVQRKNGLWGQILDDPNSWEESSASAMFAYAMMTGATRQWIAGAAYAKKARQTWNTLCGMIDQHGNIAAVCEGTNEGKDAKYYLDRPKVNGAPYGQAAMLMLAHAVMEEDAREARKKRTVWKGIGGQGTLLERAESARAVPTGTLRIETTYECLSVAYGAKKRLDKVSMEYREQGKGAWVKAMEPLYFIPGRQYRGSIMDLKEDAEYEVRLLDGQQELIKETARTWKTDVKIAKTIEIDTENATFPIVISDKGSADGWIRYVPKNRGKTLVNATYNNTFEFTDCRNVILEGFMIDGGFNQSSLLLNACDGVRIRDCEIFHFGRGGKPVWGKQRGYCMENGLGAQSAAIMLGNGPKNVTIERCLIHSPRGRAHSWRYSHPYGAEAIQYRRPDGGLVIRYCDFIGSDTRRWEDAVKCQGNGGYDTGPNRNADIYGNFFFCCNDDSIELDGGQQNVRCFRNRFEEALMGCSIQYNQTSPSYVYENLFSGLGTEFWHMGSAIKTSSVDGFHQGAASFVFRNVFMGPASEKYAGCDMTANQYTARLSVKDNLSVGKGNAVRPPTEGTGWTCDGNVTVEPGSPQAVEAAKKAPLFPMRPIPWQLSEARLDGITVTDGKVAPKASTVTLACEGNGYRQDFRVVKTACDSDWYTVEPMTGVVQSGKKIAFTITYDLSKMMNRRKHAAAFVVRTADGYSRPLTLHAQTDRVEPMKVDSAGHRVVYGTKKGNVWSFDLPAFDGEWYLMVYGSNRNNTTGDFYPEEGRIDTLWDGKPKQPNGVSNLQLVPWKTWVPCSPGGYNIYGFKREAGVHTVEVTSAAPGIEIDAMAMTDEPGLFEPEGANAMNELK